MKYLVIDVGGTFTKYAVMDEACQFYVKDKVPTRQESAEDFVDMLVNIFQMQADKIEGIALSSAGMIDSETGFMYNGGSIFCINNINIVEVLEQRCHVPVTVENDAKCAGLAEVWQGNLKDCNNAIVMICGTAVGGAVICNRKVLRGKHFMAGEFSYVLTDGGDAFNPDKTLAQINGVPALIKDVANVKGIPVEELDGEAVFSMANCGDTEALECIRKFANHLAVQITNSQFIFDPERIAVGGGISVQPLFIQLIQEELKKLNGVYPHDVPMPEVVSCKFFNDSNLIGALYVHLKSKEMQISIDKVEELLNLVKGRREGEYLRELFS